MRVVVEAYGGLQGFLEDGRRRLEMDVKENATVEEVLLQVGIDLEQPWNASLNGTLATPLDTVSEGSVILVFPPIAGGC